MAHKSKGSCKKGMKKGGKKYGDVDFMQTFMQREKELKLDQEKK